MTKEITIRPRDCTVQVHDDSAAAGRRRPRLRNGFARCRRRRRCGLDRLPQLIRLLVPAPGACGHGLRDRRRRPSLGAVILLDRFETRYVKHAIDDNMRPARWVRHTPMLTRDDCYPMRSTICQGVESAGWLDLHSLIFWICAALMTEAITTAEAATAAEWESAGTYPAKHSMLLSHNR